MREPPRPTMPSLEMLCARLPGVLQEASQTKVTRLPRGFEPHGPRSPMAPRLSYGRHRGPEHDGVRRAAVLIALYPAASNGELVVTLTRRPLSLLHHAGQVCLPGGKIEPNESAAEASIREFVEELGAEPPTRQPLGEMQPTYVFASSNVVTPIIVAGRSPESPWDPDPAEVDEVIEMPLQAVIPEGTDSNLNAAGWRLGKRSGSSQREEPIEYRFRYPAIAFTDTRGQRREIWGATAIILERFGRLIRSVLDEHSS
ncbi:MAG: CoA pyrophosphatase [Planctomycetota bacterium]